MTDTQTRTDSTATPATAPQAAGAGGCCGNTAQATAEPVPTQVTSPCCGTKAEAAAEGSCCGTAAKSVAVAARAGCCG